MNVYVVKYKNIDKTNFELSNIGVFEFKKENIKEIIHEDGNIQIESLDKGYMLIYTFINKSDLLCDIEESKLENSINENIVDNEKNNSN